MLLEFVTVIIPRQTGCLSYKVAVDFSVESVGSLLSTATSELCSIVAGHRTEQWQTCRGRRNLLGQK